MIITVPCYNEYNRLKKKYFINFLKENPDVKIVFSDDGSKDDTNKLLKEIQSHFKSQVYICNLKSNKGKDEAIRMAVLYAFDKNLNFSKIAYLDADLSVSLEECLSLSRQLNKKNIFIFGSRVSLLNNIIIRNDFRHYSGRFVATIIANLLKIKVYDTQCGCKIFDAKLAKTIFKDPFISKWLFDVELFFRIIALYSREDFKEISLEIPLKSWIDKGNSKVKISYFFKMWRDLYLIKKQYYNV